MEVCKCPLRPADMSKAARETCAGGVIVENLASAMVRGGWGATQERWTDLDKKPEQPRGNVVTRPGHLWQFGDNHRLICGDSTRPEVVARLMDGELARLVATDPPYNLRAREYSGKGKSRHGDFAMAAGEMSRTAFTDFLASERLLASSLAQ